MLQEKSGLQEKIDKMDQYERSLKECMEFAELFEADAVELDRVFASLDAVSQQIQKFEVESLFATQSDLSNCFLEINAGAGGTESHDWASIMMRMYVRFAERMGFKVEILSLLDGEEAGIKSCCIKIAGPKAYGWLKTESGVHRLVRISPFNAAGKRMTSFASAWVYPEVDDSIDIQIEDKDLRIDTYRSSGAGGQHVNTTDSAVRITHLPTNIVVQCQNDRSQHKNKAAAMKMLRAKLYEAEMRKKLEAVSAQNATKTEIGWGQQIRSYVLQPYQMVKDLRTDFETSDVNGVLDGDLEKMIYQSLIQKVGNTRV